MKRDFHDVTDPAQADAGMRVFDVTLGEDQVIQVKVGMRENVALYDEQPHLAVTGNQPSRQQLAEVFSLLATGILTGYLQLQGE